MPVILPTHARSEFKSDGFTIIDGLLTPEEDEIVCQAIDTHYFAPEPMIQSLYQESAPLKKLTTSKRFLRRLHEISGLKGFRLLRDQVLSPEEAAEFYSVERKEGEEEITLADQLCFQDTSIALLHCINEWKEAPAPYPCKKGETAIIAPHCPFSFKTGGGLYLLIVYGLPSACYRKEERDPFVNDLKKRGFAFGDNLDGQLNPLIYI